MGKAKKLSSSAQQKDEIERLATIASAKQQFVSSAMDMGWRLALTVLAPIILGTWLDKRYNTSPSWTLLGIFVAAVGAVLVVKKTLQDLNNQSNRKTK